LLPRKKWWELEIELQAVAHSLRTLEDAPGQHLLEQAFFDEVQPLAKERTEPEDSYIDDDDNDDDDVLPLPLDFMFFFQFSLNYVKCRRS
jgi:hypothetical protein